jgi:hypothetical protein
MLTQEFDRVQHDHRAVSDRHCGKGRPRAEQIMATRMARGACLNWTQHGMSF